MKRRKGKVRNKEPILLIGQINSNKQNIQLVYFNKLNNKVIRVYNMYGKLIKQR